MPDMETANDIKYDQTLDAKGLNCPLSVLKAKALEKGCMAAGTVMRMSRIDFPQYTA